MPAIQFLPQLQQQQSFGSQLGQNLGSTLGAGLGAKLASLHEKKANAKKLEGLAPVLEQLGIPKESLQGLIESGLSVEEIAPFAKLLGEGGASKTNNAASVQNVFNNMSEFLAEDAPGIGWDPLTTIGANRKGVQNRAKYKSMRGKIESVLLPLQSKGALAKDRFNFILSQIPNGDETQREQVGKLYGLAESLSEEGFPVDTSILDSIDWAQDTGKAKKKEGASKKAANESKEETILMQTPEGPKKIPKSKVIEAQKAGATLIQ